MKVRYTELSGASGSIGGVTAARNRGGNYRRVRVAPLNPNTSFQQAIRAQLAALSAAWRDVLTPAQRTAWEAYALTITETDSLGQPVKLTGLNAYIRGNSLRGLANQAFLNNAPSLQGVPVFTAPANLQLTATNAGGNVDFSFSQSVGDAWNLTAGGALHVFIGEGVTESIRFYKGPFRRWASFIRGATAQPGSLNITSDPGYPVFGGQNLFHYMRFVTTDAQGRRSSDFIVRVIADET